jgi:Cof subfamily protein (haloacid dehalogenase superfamily)
MIEAKPGLRPKLIAIDLDGTLIDRSLAIRDPVKDAIRRAQRAGVTVTIVTGRMFQASKAFAAELDLHGPIVCYQGAAIYLLKTGERIAHVPLGGPVALALVEKCKRDGVFPQLYFDDELYVEEINRYSKTYTDIARVEPIVVPSLEAELRAGRETTKFVAVLERERADAYTESVKAFAGERAYVTRSNPEFVEAVDPHVSKGTALRFLAEYMHVPLEETMAIGDAWNDVPMISIAGIGVAMGSAPPEVTKEADAVVGDVAHCGVAEAIERFVLT